MIEYRIIDTTCPLPTCLHGGALPRMSYSDSKAYVETVSDIPSGTVSRTLQAISARYGACGVLAIEDGLIIGKIRAYPQALIDIVPYPCVQQEKTVKPVIALNLDALPGKAINPVFHLYCIQVAEGYSGRGIAGGMLDSLIVWARAYGWRELRARAVNEIPPLLAWCGQLSRGALERRGFSVTNSALSPDLREGVLSQRAGFHGDAVLKQWEAFTHLSNDEASQLFDMALVL